MTAETEVDSRLAVLERCPRLTLGSFPSPVRQIRVNADSSFWLKDDGICCDVYSGNKLRKLEFLLAEARKAGVRRLVVHGDVESHTVLACGLLGRSAGFEVDAVVFPLRGQEPQNAALARLAEAGVVLHRCGSMLTTIAHAHLLGMRRQTCLVPLGGSTPAATLGYVQAAFELDSQIRTGALPAPQTIYVAFATGGTVAGLLIGLTLIEAPVRVAAVQTVEGIIANRRRLERIITKTLSLLGLPSMLLRDCLSRLESIDHRFLGSGYRDVPQATREAVDIAATLGLELESAFTGKAFAAMLDQLRRRPDERLLFWNTHSGSAGGSNPR